MSLISTSIWRCETEQSSDEESTIVPAFQRLMEFDANLGKSRGMPV